MVSLSYFHFLISFDRVMYFNKKELFKQINQHPRGFTNTFWLLLPLEIQSKLNMSQVAQR